MLVKQSDGMTREALAAVEGAICAGVDADILAGERQDHQRHQHIILDRRATERIVQGISAEIADHVVALLRDVGPGFRRGDCVGVIAASDRSVANSTLRLRRLGHAVVHRLDLAVTIEVERRKVGLGRLAVNLGSLLRQFRLAPAVDLDDRAALRQVARHPFVLGAKKTFDIGGVATVLVGRCEEILHPFDAVGLSQIVTEARVPGIHALFRQRIGDLPPGSGVTLLGAVSLPDLLLVDLARRRDHPQLLLGRHVTQRHLLQHSWQHIGKQAQLTDLADRKSESDGDRFLGPAESNKAFNTSPLVYRIERFTDAVLDHGTHRAIVVGCINDEYFDFFETGRDGETHPTMPGVNDITISAIRFRSDHRRLNDADGLDRRQHQRIGLRRRLRLAHSVGVFLQSARVNLDDLHGICPCLEGSGPAPCQPFLSSFFSKTPPGPPNGRTDATAAEHPCCEGRAGLTALRRTSSRDGAGGG